MADELCLSSTCTFKNNPCFFFFFYDLSLLCSFIFSHPLYFSYFLFFSPYLFKFIFFVSPLFFTTALLLLLSLLATTLPAPKLGFIQTVVDKLRSKLNDVEDDEEFRNFEDFEIYKIVFNDPPLITVVGDEDGDEEVSITENAVEIPVTVNVDKPEGEKSLENLFEELDRFEDSTAVIESPEKESSSDLEKIASELQNSEPEVVSKKLERKSMAVEEPDQNQKTIEKSFSVKSNSWRVDSSSSFGSYGSMRKEKEWKRTLACKLFEERHNSEGGEEGMDSLWEAYEEDNSSRKMKNRMESIVNEKKTTMKNKKKSEFRYFDEDFEEDDDDEEEFMSNGQLCCLKALKLSTGKMNLGMGKPNLVKISKALKGFGWLHHVGSKKHGKRI